LFRGREDVFPLRWQNPKTGRSGWAPRCANEWKAGVCAKPRVKCGACPNQAFVAPTECELLAHLQGRQVMGVYPLLADDTCWLLAIDLDGPSWRRDVAALSEASAELGVVPAIERSQSGAGAHAWFFFGEPVPAVLARRLGLMVLTDAMARCPTLGMASYDRLFPSQDTLPKGGFGNLIALPLQQKARRHGNTLFLDAALEPHADQWAYLDSLRRMSPTAWRVWSAVSATAGSLACTSSRGRTRCSRPGLAHLRDGSPRPRCRGRLSQRSRSASTYAPTDFPPRCWTRSGGWRSSPTRFSSSASGFACPRRARPV
jgi:hypothetical protein